MPAHSLIREHDAGGLAENGISCQNRLVRGPLCPSRDFGSTLDRFRVLNGVTREDEAFRSYNGDLGPVQPINAGSIGLTSNARRSGPTRG